MSFFKVHKSNKLRKIVIFHLLMHSVLSDYMSITIHLLIVNLSFAYLNRTRERFLSLLYNFVRVWKLDTSFFLKMLDFIVHHIIRCYISHPLFMHMRFIFAYRIVKLYKCCFESYKWNMKLHSKKAYSSSISATFLKFEYW